MPTRPEPVTKAGAIAGAVAGVVLAVGLLARTVGWLTDDVDVEGLALRASDATLAAGALWATLAPFVLALRARGKVTPLADPRTATGAALVPAGELDTGQALADLVDVLDDLAELVAACLPRTSTAAPAPAGPPPELSPAHNAELAPSSLYDELVAEAGGPPTVEFPAVRVIDTPPPPPRPPATVA